MKHTARLTILSLLLMTATTWGQTPPAHNHVSATAMDLTCGHLKSLLASEGEVYIRTDEGSGDYFVQNGNRCRGQNLEPIPGQLVAQDGACDIGFLCSPPTTLDK